MQKRPQPLVPQLLLYLQRQGNENINNWFVIGMKLFIAANNKYLRLHFSDIANEKTTNAIEIRFLSHLDLHGGRQM